MSEPLTGSPRPTIRFTFEAGALVRKMALSRIRRLVFRHGLEMDVEEDRRFLSSAYRVTLTGDNASVQSCGTDLTALLAELKG